MSYWKRNNNVSTVNTTSHAIMELDDTILSMIDMSGIEADVWKFKLTILMQRYWHNSCHYYVIIYDNIST